MSNVAKLKKQAAELELKKQFDKALAIYVRLLDSFDENASELDVALFNRVGDLMLRQGNVADAVDYYEKAVDRYADTGFFNNAIALCNKILRHSPGRASVYYKLGKISAQKGFNNDAKVNFLEYADRMQKGGKVDEAFRALKEFADLCPDQDEIRLMLADQLIKANRRGEAVEQLQILHERYDAEGRGGEAAATAARMRAIDPTVQPRAAVGRSRKTTSGELIFLDLDTPSPGTSGALRTPTPPRAIVDLGTPISITPQYVPAEPEPEMEAESEGELAVEPEPEVVAEPEAVSALELEPEPGPEPDAEPSLDAIRFADPGFQSATPSIVIDPLADVPLSGVMRIGEEGLSVEKSTPSTSLLGLESTTLDDVGAASATPASSHLLDFEPTSLGAGSEPVEGVDGSATPAHGAADVGAGAGAGGEVDMMLPESVPTPAEGSASIDLELTELPTPPVAAPGRPSRPTPTSARAALEGLPLMDLEVPVPSGRGSGQSAAMPSSDELELVESIEPEPTPVSSTPVDLDTESLTLDDDETILVPTPSATRKSTMVAAHSVEILKASVEGDPENWSLHRALAEAMLDAGDRQGGIKELEMAMSGAEAAGDLDLASSIAEEIARLEPESVRHHQKRVEYAFRRNDRGRLIEAYVSLADTLLRSDQADKARTVYQRVIDLAPDDMRARAALETIPAPETEAPPPPRSSVAGQRRSTAATPAAPPKPAAQPQSDGFFNLGDWLRDSEGPKDTRMVVNEQEPTGDEEADFADMLRKFKQGVAENVDAEDYQSHYDLAIAFKEMGLIDEAIAEFQKALGSPANRLPTYEALGQCFLDKSQFKLASSILQRALNEKASEDQLVGVLYLLGRAAEAQANVADALTYYQRVFVLDIQFRDIAERLSELERSPR